MKKFFLYAMILALTLSLCNTAFCSDNDNDKYIVVDIEGQGTDRNSAIESAWLGGLRQAVGAVIDSRTELNNDQLTERIISYSRGVVDKYEILGADESQSGIYKIKMRLWIIRDLLRDGAKHASSRSAEISFSPADILKRKAELDAKAAKELESRNAAEETAKQKSKSGAELLKATLERYKPEDFLSCYIPGKPELVKGKTDVFRLNVELTFNDKLYSESFIPDLIQVLDQISAAKKNTLLVKYKTQLRTLAAKKEALSAENNNSIILTANSDTLGKNFSLAVYNRPQNFGCRLYNFTKDDSDKILSYRSGEFANFFDRTQKVKGLMLELLDEDKEVIETIEKRFNIAFLITKDSAQSLYSTKYIWSIQPTIMINLDESDKSTRPPPPPSGITVTGLNNGRVSSLTPSIKIYASSYPNNNEISEKDSNFPFTIRPAASFKGRWTRNSRDYNYKFDANPVTPLQSNTTYTVRIKSIVANSDIQGKSFSFTTPVSWQEKKQFIIPVDLEMPEEVLPAVKNIKVSLLIE
ncbi:MAG: hypothetical protein IJS99_00960 [Synergistaceae bacterium]|nr:hypothetical protein [Synergistaceae bacterium]